jgi:hypothetical protein
MASTNLTIQEVGVNCTPTLEGTGAKDNYDYLITLLDSYDKSLMDQPFHPAFGEFSNFAELDKQDINKIVFTSLVAPQANVDTAQIAANLIEGVKAIESDVFESDNLATLRKKRDSIRSRVRKNRDYAREYYNNYEKSLATMQVYQEEYEGYKAQITALRGADDNINHALVEAIAETVASGKWHYMGRERPIFKQYSYKTSDIDYDEMNPDDYSEEDWDRGWYIRPDVDKHNETFLANHFFCSTEPITVRQVNTSAGINESYKVGYIMFGVSNHGCITEASVVGDFVHNGYSAHPHLSRKSICWGTASSPHMNNYEAENYGIAKSASLFYNLMEEYCPDNPYVTISTLHEVEEILGDRYEHCFDDTYLCNLDDIFCPDWLKPYAKEAQERIGYLSNLFNLDDIARATEAIMPLVNGRLCEASDVVANNSIYDCRSLDDMFDQMEKLNMIMPEDDFRCFHQVNMGYLRNYASHYNYIVSWVFLSAMYYKHRKGMDIVFYRRNWEYDDNITPNMELTEPKLENFNFSSLTSLCARWSDTPSSNYYIRKFKYMFIRGEQ